MSDQEDQRNLTPDGTLDTPLEGDVSPALEGTPQVDPEAKKPLPKRSFADNFLRGCGYVLLAAAIIIMLLFGACYIMLLSYH